MSVKVKRLSRLNMSNEAELMQHLLHEREVATQRWAITRAREQAIGGG